MAASVAERIFPADGHASSQLTEEVMWQVYAALRFGDYRTPEFDVTPALGITFIVAVIALIIRTGL